MCVQYVRIYGIYSYTYAFYKDLLTRTGKLLV